MKNQIAACGGSEIYLGCADELLDELLPEARVVVVTDPTVGRLHGTLMARYESVIISEGEASKSLETAAALYRRFAEMGLDRHTFVVAVGGGVVSDMAGFVAATYMRGMRFGVVPTTLLAQVDASIGGKNGVNLDGYKNMVGTFSQPEFVVIDTSLLETLSEREFRSGLAEVIKSAIIGDRMLFELLERSSLEALRRDGELLAEVVAASVRVKTGIVSHDERETDLRRLLNLGHTFGHAIEHCTAQYTHGEAVAIGIVMAASAAVRQGLLDTATHDRIVNLLERYGFETSCHVPTHELLDAVTRDKKGNRGNIALVLPTAVGGCSIRPMGMAEIVELIKE